MAGRTHRPTFVLVTQDDVRRPLYFTTSLHSVQARWFTGTSHAL